MDHRRNKIGVTPFSYISLHAISMCNVSYCCCWFSHHRVASCELNIVITESLNTLLLKCYHHKGVGELSTFSTLNECLWITSKTGVNVCGSLQRQV